MLKATMKWMHRLGGLLNIRWSEWSIHGTRTVDGFVPKLVATMAREVDFVTIQTDCFENRKIKPRTVKKNRQAMYSAKYKRFAQLRELTVADTS